MPSSLPCRTKSSFPFRAKTISRLSSPRTKPSPISCPIVSLSAGWNYTSNGGVLPAHSISPSPPACRAQWNLFNGFRDYYSVKSADQTIEQQKQLIFDLEQTVLLDVVQTYYAILTSEQSVEVLSNSLHGAG